MKQAQPLLPYLQAGRLEAGCDEAGRGCLAGPVFAAAVILPPDVSNPHLQDSKKLSKKQRSLVRTWIEAEALAWAVASISPAQIDRLNILQASLLAMHQAIEQLQPVAEFLLIDGHKFLSFYPISHQCVVKGDGKYQSIAAASILAKTHRDEFMVAAASQYPQYGWEQNKGYPTVAHREALQEHGPSPLHRKSFRWQKVSPNTLF